MGHFKSKLSYGRGGVKKFIKEYLFKYKKQKYSTVRELHKTIDKNDKDQQELLWEAKKNIERVNISTYGEQLDISTIRSAADDLHRLYKDNWGSKRP